MNRRILAGCSLLLVPLLVWADWRVFRGDPRQQGVARGSVPGLLQTLWTLRCDDAFEGAVAVQDQVVYAGCLDEHLYALDLESGRQKWKYKAGPIKAAPIVRKGEVIIGDLDGMVHAVSTDGKKLWTFETGAEVGGLNFSGDDVLVTSHDETLYCLTKAGKERWKFKTEGPVYGAPAVADGVTFLVGCDSMLHVICVQKGQELRSVELGGQTGATAAVLGDVLYVGTMKNEVRAIDWKKGSDVWTFVSPRRPAQAYFASAAVTDKLVVVGCRDNRIYAIDRARGKLAWDFPTGGKVDSSPVVAGDKVIVGSYDGKLYVLDLKTGRELQRITLDGPVSASPVVVDGKVIVGTQKGTLYALGEKK